jgi:hypothetical protein
MDPRTLDIIMLMAVTTCWPPNALPKTNPGIVYLDTANDVGAEARTALFRLAWDFVGSGLGGRVELYERFYLGSRSRNRKMMHVSSKETTGWLMGSSPDIRRRGNELVDGMLDVAR